jgi:lipid-binding SYLF domain-containing protein
MLKGGFLAGGTFGRGVLLVRDQAGAWSNPIFVTVGGGSFGFQAGVQAIDLILVFRNRRALDSFLQGRGKITLGVDAAVSAGPLGRHASAGTDVRLSSEILTYSRSRGLFAGVSAEGAVLKLDWKSLAAYYGQVVSPNEILGGSPIPAPASAETLRARLNAASTGAPPGPPPADAAPPDDDGLLPEYQPHAADPVPPPTTRARPADDGLLPESPPRNGRTSPPANPNVQTAGGGDVVILDSARPTALRGQSPTPTRARGGLFQWRRRQPSAEPGVPSPTLEPALDPAAKPPR